MLVTLSWGDYCQAGVLTCPTSGRPWSLNSMWWKTSCLPSLSVHSKVREHESSGCVYTSAFLRVHCTHRVCVTFTAMSKTLSSTISWRS